MKNHTERNLASPALLSPGARVLVAAGVLVAMALVGLLVEHSSHDAVDRKLAEFEVAPALAHAVPAAEPGQARVSATQHDRYHAALREEETIGCERAGRRPS